MKLIEQIVEAMSEVRGAMHVNDIATLMSERFPHLGIPMDDLPAKIGNVLASDVKKGQKAFFSKVKNKQGGLKRGVYRLKKRPEVKPKATEAPIVSNQYTGKAGEFSVMSELLFYGFNASAMTVDDGIDVVASKGGNYFHIQVKTANVSVTGGGFGFSIKKTSFSAKDSFQTFYIFVIRENRDGRYLNDYLIMPSSQLRQLLEVGIIKDGASLSVRVQRDTRGRYILNAKQDVTISVNTFSQLT